MRVGASQTPASATASRGHGCLGAGRRAVQARFGDVMNSHNGFVPDAGLALSPLVSELGLRFIFAVLFLSALSFLGLGVQPPDADWGGMVKENKEGIVFGIPAALIPAAAIAALAISVNLVADWVLNRTSDLKGGRSGG